MRDDADAWRRAAAGLQDPNLPAPAPPPGGATPATGARPAVLAAALLPRVQAVRDFAQDCFDTCLAGTSRTAVARHGHGSRPCGLCRATGHGSAARACEHRGTRPILPEIAMFKPSSARRLGAAMAAGILA